MVAAIADTSVFIAAESGRRIASALPDELAVSIVTIGELRAGLLAAEDFATRVARLNTLTGALQLDPIPVNDRVAEAWAELRIRLRDAGKRMPVNDSWIAATAIAHDLAVATQDDDYLDVPGLRVIRL